MRRLIVKFFIQAHRILGVLCCLLCFAWCISGLVLLYHSFPRVGADVRLPRQVALDSAELLPMDLIWQRIPEQARKQNLSLNNPYGQPVFHYGYWRSANDIYMDSTYSLPEDIYPLCEQHAREWLPDRNIIRVDTMYTQDIWIPYDQLRRDLPVYAFYYDGPEDYHLYVSSRTGDVIHFSSREQRFWAWVGAIPHWLYIMPIRLNTMLWGKLLYWSSVISFIMCLTGIVVGIRAYWLNRRKGFLRSPYKKQWFKWHHITGFIFGLFLSAWLFSAWGSTTPWVADLLSKQQREEGETFFGRMNRSLLPPETYRLDYRTAIAAITREKGAVKEIAWGRHEETPIYKIRTVDSLYTVDASADTVRPFRITEEMIYASAKRLSGDSVKYTVTKMEEYDNYYISWRKGRLPLPAYKVELETKMRDVYYYNLESDMPQHFNDANRWRRWTWRGLHFMEFKFLLDRPVVWTIVIWVLVLGCAAVSFTGIILSIKYLFRLCRRSIKRKKVIYKR